MMADLSELVDIKADDENSKLLKLVIQMTQATSDATERALHDAAAARSMGAQATNEIARHEETCGLRYNEIDKKQTETVDLVKKLRTEHDKEKWVSRSIAGGIIVLLAGSLPEPVLNALIGVLL